MEHPHRTIPRLGVVAVVLSVALSGCSGIVPGLDDETDRSPYTVDDSLESNETEQIENETPPDTDYLAPGVTTDGIENVSLLVEHHFTVMESESSNGTYVAVGDLNTTSNGSLIKQSHDRFVVQYPERWYNSFTRIAYQDNASDTRTVETWSTESLALTRLEGPNRSIQYRSSEPREPPGHPSFLERDLRGTLSGAASDSNVTVEEETRNETTWYSLTWDGESEDSPTTFNTTVYIREDGFIESWHTTTIKKTFSGEIEVARSRFEFKLDANATLERPGWYEEGVEATDDTE